jgi:mannosyltransferase
LNSTATSRQHADDIPERRYALALSALLAFAFLLRAWQLGRDSIWFDEAVSIGIARLPWNGFIRAWIGQVNSGLYYLLVRGLLVLGESEVYLRLSSVVCGVAAIGVFAEFTRRISNRSTALLVAALLSFNVNASFYAREIRGYGLLLLLVSLGWLLFERCLRSGERRWFVLWAACWIAAMYVHMFSVLVLVAQLCVACFDENFQRRMRSFIRSCLWIGFGYVPMALMIYQSHRQQISWVPPLSAKTTNRFFLELSGDSHWLLWINVVLFAIATFLFVANVLRRKRGGDGFVLATATIGTVVPIALLGLLSIVQPAFLARYGSHTVPTLALAGAVAIARLPRLTWAPAVLVVGTLSVFAVRNVDAHPPAYEQRNDFRSATRYIAEHAQPGDVIASYGPQARYGLEYYGRRLRATNFPAFVYPGDSSTPEAPEFAPQIPEVAFLDRISRRHRRIWFFLDRNAPDKDLGIVPHFFVRRLGMGHRLVSETHFQQGIVYEFQAQE